MESIEQNTPKTINGYKVVDDNIKESITPYYTDIYSPGETKEQLIIGQEVAKPKEITGTIDTSDSSLQTTENTYSLTVPNPDGKIFSIGITFQGVTTTKTFKVGFFGSSATAYADLETQLQNWLGTEYIVDYDSGTTYNISRVDGQEFSKTSPNLVRTITLTGFDTISIIDVIVDGVTVTLNGATHSGNSSTAITYLKSQLSSSIYYLVDNINVLEIARKDGAIPVITKTQYNKYTYELTYQQSNTPSSGQFLDYTDTTIDSVTHRFTTFGDTMLFPASEIVRDLKGFEDTISFTNTTEANTTVPQGVSFTVLNNNSNRNSTKAITVTKDSACTATTAVLGNYGGSTISTVSFVGNVATFNVNLVQGNSYEIACWSGGSSYTPTKSSFGTTQYSTSHFISTRTSAGDVWNIAEIKVGTTAINLTGYNFTTTYNKASGSDSIRTYNNYASYFSYTHTLGLYKNDYSTISISSVNHYTTPGSFADDSLYTGITSTNHLADIAVGTLTEITITLTHLTNTYFIPIPLKIKKIVMNAVASGGSSVGVWENSEQSCTAKYGTTTAFVDDYIFKTDANNYGKITLYKKGGIIMQWTTNTSNKIDYICT